MTCGDMVEILVNIKDKKYEYVTQCLGWTTDIYLSMVTDTVDLIFKWSKQITFAGCTDLNDLK